MERAVAVQRNGRAVGAERIEAENAENVADIHIRVVGKDVDIDRRVFVGAAAAADPADGVQTDIEDIIARVIPTARISVRRAPWEVGVGGDARIIRTGRRNGIADIGIVVVDGPAAAGSVPRVVVGAQGVAGSIEETERRIHRHALVHGVVDIQCNRLSGI